LTLLAGFFGGWGSADVRAQAWLSPKGEGVLSLTYGHSLVRSHSFADGRTLDVGHVGTDTMAIDFGYAITDRIGVTLGLPYVASRYQGPRPHQFPIDDGHRHSGVQDFRGEVRWQALRGPIALAPFAAVVLPSHNYEYFGHSSIGRQLRGLSLGAALGRRLNPILPAAYLQGQYAFTVEERVLGRSPRRSNLSLELGYFVTPSVSVFALAAGQQTHGGLDVYLDYRQKLTAEQYHHHDQMLRSNYLELGGGAAVALTQSLQAFGSLITTRWSENGHAISLGVSVGLTWSVSPAQLLRSARPASRTLHAGS
jgi:hypothetical protein